MATANIFTKDGVLVASVTDASLTGRCCDYIGNGRFVMASNSDTVHFGNVSAKAMSFDRSFTITDGAGPVVQVQGVAVQKDVQDSEDPHNCSSNLVYVLYRVNT